MTTLPPGTDASNRPACDADASLPPPAVHRTIHNFRPPIYPPGAVPDFRWKCTGCGDCITACPVEALVLITHPLSDRQVPVIVPSRAACVMCEDVPCIQACTDRALQHHGDRIFPKLGTAHIDHARCLAYIGSVCRSCYDACPLQQRAITLRYNRPEILTSACTGCGLCEQACVVTEDKAVQIFPAGT